MESSSKSAAGRREGGAMAGAEGHSRSKSGLEGDCVGCNATLPRRPTRAGGLGVLGGWSEEEKVWNAFWGYLQIDETDINPD